MNPNTPPTPQYPPVPEPAVAPPPVNNLPLKRKRYGRLIFILLVALLLCVVVGGGVWFGLSQVVKKSSTSGTATSASIGGAHEASSSINKLKSAYDSFFKEGVDEFTSSKKESTIAAYDELSKGFKLNDAFYDDTSSQLIALGIAQLYLGDATNYDAYRNELYLLSYPHMEHVPDGIDDTFFSSSTADQKQTLATFEKYKDTTLTNQLTSVLASSGLLSEVVSALKTPNTSSLENARIIVFDFDNTSSRQADFAKEHYMYGAQPTMWVESVGEDIYILITKNYAQSFISQPQGPVRSKIHHEYIHTQNVFSRGDLGRTIEERRAELFSGDKSAYYDAKQMMIYAEVFSGNSLTDMLEKSPTNPSAFYLSLYKTFGVKSANHILASWPSAYLGNPSGAVKKVNSFTSGLDGAIHSIITNNGDSSAKKMRVKARYEKLLGIFGSKEAVLNDIKTNLALNYRMPTAAKEMEAYIATLP